MDQMRAGQACHRFPGSFFNIIHAPLQQKSPCSPKGTGTENTLSAVPPCLLIKISRLITVPTHRLPVNAGIASEDTLGDPSSPCPQRPIYCLAYRSALSSRNSLWMRFAVLLPPQWFAIEFSLLYRRFSCVSIENFEKTAVKV